MWTPSTVEKPPFVHLVGRLLVGERELKTALGCVLGGEAVGHDEVVSPRGLGEPHRYAVS